MIKPSAYIAAATQSIQNSIEKAQKNKISIVQLLTTPITSDLHIDSPLFIPSKTEITLRNYIPFTQLKIDQITHPQLTIQHANSTILADSKTLNTQIVAPGIETGFVVYFTPIELVDFDYNVVCTTERERFLVPIRVIGARAILDFPDEVSFLDSPVRFTTTKTLLVRNIGNKPIKFNLVSLPPFFPSPQTKFIQPNELVQIDIDFRPTKTGCFSQVMKVEYDSGECCGVGLFGSCEDLDVRLEKRVVGMESTYITLSSSKVVRIFNRSDITSSFEWKLFANDLEDRQFRAGKLLEQELRDEEEKNLFLMNKAREIENESYPFNDEIFSIEPIRGQIWPNSSIEVKINFHPNFAGLQEKTLFCQVSGRESRLPLVIKGEAIGPNAKFSYDVLDLENVFINSLHRYEVILENYGAIDVDYKLKESSTIFSSKFKFEPSSGIVKIGQQQKCEILFNSNILGSFEEEFSLQLKGSTDLLVLTAKGSVVGPTFTFDIASLDFGNRAFGFLTSRTFNLINTSHIPMTFNLRIPDESNAPSLNSKAREEFLVTPSFGVIEALGEQKIQVEFKPLFVKKYETWLIVDIENVGDNMYKIPVTAESVVSDIKVKTPILNYGGCYINYPYHVNIELSNETNLPVRYNLTPPQDQDDQNIYAYKSKNPTGIIEPNSIQKIDLELKLKRLGDINFPVFIQILGREAGQHNQLMVDISALGFGPTVNISSNELNFGKVSVLKDTPLTLSLKNDSPIEAEFGCSVVSEDTVFTVFPVNGCIPPGGEVEVVVKANLDDCLKFTDILKVNIPSDGVHEIQLVAKGFGSTITFDQNLLNVDFKDLFSNRVSLKEFYLTNKGRRLQTLYWSSDEKQKLSTKEPWVNMFEVVPNRLTLRPGQQHLIKVKGFSSRSFLCKEILQCHGTIDKDPTRRHILSTHITANFINPIIEISSQSLHFVSEHTKDDDFKILTKDLRLKNVTALPLNIQFNCPKPYSIDFRGADSCLDPDSEIIVGIQFDPSHNINRISKKEHQKLTIGYLEHPQKDIVELHSDMLFPNLSISQTCVNFGCIPKDTEQKRCFNMKNCGTLPVYYSWAFLEGSVVNEALNSVGGVVEEIEEVPIYQIFDIIPLSGWIQPGETEFVEVNFYGHQGNFSYIFFLYLILESAELMCDVNGGPKYQVKLIGEASSINFHIDREVIDFGCQLYQEILEQEIVLTNMGHVSFEYNVQIPSSSVLLHKVMISPSTAIIPPFSKQKLIVKFCSCFPEVVEDFFTIQIAHFERIKILVQGVGTFPEVELNLPRLADEKYDNIFESLKKKNILSNVPRKWTAGKLEERQTDKIDTELASEAERIYLKEKTSEFLNLFGEEIKLRNLPLPKTKYVGSSILAQKMMSKDHKSHMINETSIVELASYLCSFGNVIKNTSKKRSFTITNRSAHLVTFQLDKTLFEKTCFSIEPEKVKIQPNGDPVEFKVTFHAKGVDLGVFSTSLPLRIVGGPTIQLILRAEITVPDFNISTKDISFGDVICGQRKTIYVAFHNTNMVPCEWTSQPAEVNPNLEKPSKSSASSVKKAINNRTSKKQIVATTTISKDLVLVPSFGVLQPNEKAIIMIRFCPVEEKIYNLTVPIKINLNPKPTSLKMTGSGVKLIVQFDPDLLEMGPALPCSDAIESKVQIFNPTNFPIELYSIEFDQQHLEEDEILRRVETGENGAIYIPPREPGQLLPESLLESVMQKSKSVVETTSITPIFKIGDLPIDLFEPIINKQKEWSLTDRVPTSLIIHGPPFSGKTTQSRRICKNFGQTYIKLDELIENHKDEQLVEAIKTETEEVLKASTPPTEDIEPPVVFIESTEGLMDSRLINLSEDMLLEMLKTRLQKEDCVRNGFVIDGLDSKYFSGPMASLKALVKLAAPDRRKPIFVHLVLDVQNIHDREIKALRANGDKDADIFQFKGITDEDYDNLTNEEMDQYDAVMILYKKKMKEISERRKTERRHWEEGLAVERKEEDSKKGKKKGPQKPTPAIQQPNLKPEKGAATLATKVDLKIAKSNGALSPKPVKKDRDREKDRVDKGGNQVDGEELNSRLNLLDLIDSFYLDTTYRRFEQYFFSIDTILAFVKDGEKSTPNKKISKLKVINPTIPAVASSDSNPDLPIVPPEKPIEESAILNAEFNTTLDENVVYKNVSELIPVFDKTDETLDDIEFLPPPLIEQVIFPSPDRPEAPKFLKYFTLLPPSNASDNDDDLIGAEAALIASPVKADTGRKIKSNAKEEVKVETEEDNDKDLLHRYRWIIPPNEKKEITLKFSSNEIGKYEQVLNFEIVGCKGKYSLKCVGHCQHSQVSNDPKKIFAKCRKSKEEKVIIHSEYLFSSGVFEFGSLLYNKPREKYMERFPENHTMFTFSNTFNAEVKLSFGFKNDIKGDTFFFDPPAMELLPGESQQLSVWAFPKSATHYEDTLVCCVKDNPEPYFIKVSCVGVKPEIEIDKKFLSFEKLLLGRKEERELKVKNNTTISIGWHLAQIEGLGDEFEISPVEGFIEPYQESIITARFQGNKPAVVKRIIRLEVFDIEKIAGVVQEIPILVTAEAYDIAMELHFPKGYDGGLDFGVQKVSEEGKQSCTLKNKGKYEVGYKFIFDQKDISDLFTVTPQTGIMPPSDKPYVVQVVFKTNREMSFKDVLGLKCQFFEPSTGEITHTQPVRLSVRAVFSKFSLLPVRDLNFGALTHGSKGNKQFVIENLGEFDFRFSIYKQLHVSGKRGGTRLSKTLRPPSPPPVKPTNRKEPNNKLDASNFGPFTVFPINGLCATGQKQLITVEFHPESSGTFEEIIAVDISERSPHDQDIIEYKIMGESFHPGINTTDFSSIFEEHTLCKRLELFNNQSNIYAEEDRVFYFGAYLAGQQAQIRVKISNPFKVACDVAISTRSRTKTKNDAADFAFDVEPKKLNIQSHEHKYVVVSFHPTSIQSYAGIFEAIVENINESKNKTLTFELRGEGTLPRISVEKPVTRNKNGIQVLKFPKILVGSSQKLHITVKNEGIITSKMKAEWVYKDGVDDFICPTVNMLHLLKPMEFYSFEVTCKPNSIKKFEAELKIKVLDNAFEDTSILLNGEGYLDDLTFENLSSNSATGENEIIFSNCYIKKQKSINFSITNHSIDVLRISFPETGEFIFSPNTMHLRPRSSRDIKVSFTAKQPCEIIKQSIVCKAVKIQYLSQNLDIDWDDRLKSTKWIVPDGTAKNQSPKKILENLSEPIFEVLQNSSSEHIILAGAFADYSSYECDVTEIEFKPTLMYQTRVYRFNVKNTGKVNMKYSFLFFDNEGASVEMASIDCPFSITPNTGSLDVGEVLAVSIKFSPTDEEDFKNFHVVFMVPNLASDAIPLNINVSGTSLRPFCHFELEDSDYIANERSNPEISLYNKTPAVLEPGTRVIEFGSCGIKVRNTKRFYIVNPTFNKWEFEWTMVSGNDQRMFRCLTTKGVVLPQKKFEIIFEFTPESTNLMESLWRFNILKQPISVPLLLVGKALEPNIYIDRVSVNFKSLLVKRQARETVKLINNEKIPFSFSFNEPSSELTIDGTPVVQFSPMSGTVGAISDVPIEIIFNPSAEKVFNFNLMCNVKKKPTPVMINVKGEGYEIHDSLQSELLDGEVFNFSSTNENAIDFGQVQMNEKRIKRVTIINSGKFNFEFAWRFLTKNKGISSISPEYGTVNKGDRVICDISFAPTSSNAPLKPIKGVCQILNGRSYPFSILGTGVRPLLKFSKLEHDFGTQFLFKTGMTPSSTTFKITNEDLKEIFYDISCAQSNIFEVQRGPNSLVPGASVDIEVLFYPRNAMVYSEIIKIEINGLSTIDLTLKGEGAAFKVELVQPESRNVNFGAARVGHVISRQVKLVNRSSISATFTLGPATTIDLLYRKYIQMSPSGNTEISLRPKGVCTVDIKFAPLARISPFFEDIVLETPGYQKPMFSIQGACQGIDIKLENDTLPFGAVVQKSYTTRRIQLQNAGDIGAKFHWDTSKFQPEFKISPSEGYISPGMDIPLEISFSPLDVNPDIRYDNLLCTVEGTQSLYLTLTGMCIPQPPQTETIKFSTPVRVLETKSIPIANKSSSFWRIRPIIENEYWTGAEIFDVEPGQTKSYDVSFLPLEMTGDGQRLEGSIFFPLSDGSGLLYKLSGSAEKPVSSGTINREVPCKTAYIEVLSVPNWLKRSQRFKVIIEVVKPDPSVLIKGHDFIDVPSLLSRDYKLSYYAYKEGVTNAKVIFRNDQTQEFCFYNVAFKSTPPGVISTFEMSTVVRMNSVKDIAITNPLAIPVTFNTVSSHADLIAPHSFTIQPKTEGSFQLEFLPLIPREATARVTASSVELGVYQYDFKLVSTPAGSERNLHFKIGLGGNQIQTFRFLSYSKVKTEYTCKIDQIDFSVDKSIFAPPAGVGGVEVCVDVTYEPSKLGDVRTNLSISSSTGGDYFCPIYGHCIAPRPQGPIIIKPGSLTTVPFKNVFTIPANFQFIIDNPSFTIKAAESIGAKKSINMTIGYKSSTESKHGGGSAIGVKPMSGGVAVVSKVGKLTVSNSNPNVSWVYYLKTG